MFLKALLTVRHEGCFTEKLVNGARMTQISSDREREILLLQASEPMVEDFLAWIKATRGWCDVVEREAGAVVVHTSILPGGVIAAIESQKCTIQWPATFADGVERYTVLAPDKAHLLRVVQKLSSMGKATIDWTTSVPIPVLDITTSPLADVMSTFSSRQLAVLRTAIEMGYYDTPRRTSTEEIAARFGLSRSTVDEHLRKAERRVLERFVSVLRASPQLEAIARVKPGRPAKRMRVHG